MGGVVRNEGSKQELFGGRTFRGRVSVKVAESCQLLVRVELRGPKLLRWVRQRYITEHKTE